MRTCPAAPANSSSSAPAGPRPASTSTPATSPAQRLSRTPVWFWTLRRGFSWFSIQAGLVAPIFLLELMLTHPSVRRNILAFLLLYAAGGGVVLVISVPYAARYGFWRSVLWAPTWFAFAFLRRIGTLEAAISLPVRPFPAPARSGARPPTEGTAADELIAGEPASVLLEAAHPGPAGASAAGASAGWADGGWADVGEADPGWADADPRWTRASETDPGWAEAGPRWADVDPRWVRTGEADYRWADAGPRWPDADPGWPDADWPGRHDAVQGELVADGPEEDPVPTPTRPGLLLPGDD
jgi:hypothetical protein